jgi:hypothetical protein
MCLYRSDQRDRHYWCVYAGVGRGKTAGVVPVRDLLRARVQLGGDVYCRIEGKNIVVKTLSRVVPTLSGFVFRGRLRFFCDVTRQNVALGRRYVACCNSTALAL